MSKLQTKLSNQNRDDMKIAIKGSLTTNTIVEEKTQEREADTRAFSNQNRDDMKEAIKLNLTNKTIVKAKT